MLMSVKVVRQILVILILWPCILHKIAMPIKSRSIV